ncbi:Amino acid transporter, transmembrane [Cynara cardunculus var. scolymus]|uniref:Amino acid transporter, transmembrane n=1 Tax=Cynara cardunculus var. scolymus TaxID=59895 RepID=A0A103XBX0_CYNCS|nr:Amino acid transporter, transmembrane [Cynara cardunculus var. scolymus]
MGTQDQQYGDDKFPITSSRYTKWWYLAFHNVTTMVRASVLSLPYAMSELGWLFPHLGDIMGCDAIHVMAIIQKGSTYSNKHGCCSYSTIAWTISLKKVMQSDAHYGYKAKSMVETMFNFYSALGDVAFAYADHNVVLEIQAPIPSTPEKPSKVLMWKGVVVAYIVVVICYFSVALIGYWMYANEVFDNILISLEKPIWLIAMANLFINNHVIGSHQDRNLLTLDEKLIFCLVSCGFPSINPKNGAYVGSLIRYLLLNIPKTPVLGIYQSSLLTILPKFMMCIVLRVALMVVSLIGGLRQIIVQAKTYKNRQQPSVLSIDRRSPFSSSSSVTILAFFSHQSIHRLLFLQQ